MDDKIKILLDDIVHRKKLLEKTEERIIDTGIFDKDSTIRLHHISKEKELLDEIIDKIYRIDGGIPVFKVNDNKYKDELKKAYSYYAASHMDNKRLMEQEEDVYNEIDRLYSDS